MTKEDKTITIDDVQENVSNGVYNDVRQSKRTLYNEKHIFDENKTVKWNREKVVAENKKVDEFNEKVENNKFKGVNGFSKDLKEAIAYELGFNSKQADVIYRQAWEDGHSSGLNEVIYEAMDLVSLFEAVNDAK